MFFQDAAAIQTAWKVYRSLVRHAEEIDLDEARDVCNSISENKRDLAFSSLELPGEDDLLGAIKHARHSACVKDGMPYAAHKVVPSLAATGLVDAMRDFNQLRLPLSLAN